MRWTFTKIIGLALILSAILFFSCKRKNHTPLVPLTPLGPDSGKTGITYHFSTSTYDPDEDSISYQFDWGNSDTSNWSYFVTSGSSITMAKFWTDTGNYTVRARAKDNKDAISDWSNGQNINIVLVVPNKSPDIPSQPDGYTSGIPDTIYSFRTSADDPENQLVAYQFDWGDGDTSNWSDFVASGGSLTMSKSWSGIGIYSVRARAKDSLGAVSDWSEPCSVAIVIKWRFKTDDNIYSSPAVSDDGTIYFTSDDYYLYALYPNGSLKWRYYVSNHDSYSSPVVGPDGTIYFGCYNNLFYALNPDGTLKWQYTIASGVLPSPTVGPDGTAYFSSYDGFLYAMNTNGTLKWRCGIGEVFRSAVSIGLDNTLYFHDGVHIYALNSDSTLKWQYPTEAASSRETDRDDFLRSSPSIDADGTIYCSLSDGYFYALNSDGSLKWRYQIGGTKHSSPSIGLDGTIYLGSNDKVFYALNPAGSLKWQYKTGSYINSSPLIGSDGIIYFGSHDEYLYVFNSDGTLKWRGEFERDISSSPAISSDGTIYFGSGDEFFYAVYGTGQLANTPWPKYRHDSRNSGSFSGR